MEEKSKNQEEESGKSLLLNFRDNMNPDAQKQFSYDDWRVFVKKFVEDKYRKRFLRHIDRADMKEDNLFIDMVFLKNVRRSAIDGFFRYIESQPKAVVRGVNNLDGTVRFPSLGDIDAK